MNPDDFTFVARLLKDRVGLLLTRDKSYLVQNRLAGLLRAHGLANTGELVAALRKGDDGLATDVVDAMMSRDTAFFRDWKPFKHLSNVVLPNLRAARAAKRQLRILSMGCSTGQEAYSVAMQVIEEAESFAGWQVEIVGLDVSPAAIAIAERGLYNQFEVQRGLPIRSLLRHFTREGENWRIKDDLKRLVSFRAGNVLADIYPLGRFDVILCRNLLIGFDQQTKLEVLQKLSRSLNDDGMLYVGVDESLTGVSGSFAPVLPNIGVYGAQTTSLAAARAIAVARSG